MNRIQGVPLYQVTDVSNAGLLYTQLMNLIVKFAEHGLIHGDFNEFNILLSNTDESPIVIDFPQMISTSHANASL